MRDDYVPRRRRARLLDDDAPPAGLTGAARACKAAYERARARFETDRHGARVRYRAPRRYDGSAAVETDGGMVLRRASPCVWAEVVAQLCQRGVDPAEYLAVQFSSLDPSARPPEPTDLLADRYWQRWLAAYAKKADYLTMALSLQNSLAVQRILYARQAYGQLPDDAHASVLPADLRHRVEPYGRLRDQHLQQLVA